MLLGKSRGFVMEHALWGEEYGIAEISDFISSQGIRGYRVDGWEC